MSEAMTVELPKRMPTSFLGLNKMHPLRPIHDQAEFDMATAIVDRLSGRVDRTPDQTDYLGSLMTLVEAYEAERMPVDVPEDIPINERIAELCELNEMKANDLGELLGNRALGSKILRGDREPSKAHIRILSDRFKVSANYFL